MQQEARDLSQPQAGSLHTSPAAEPNSHFPSKDTCEQKAHAFTPPKLHAQPQPTQEGLITEILAQPPAESLAAPHSEKDPLLLDAEEERNEATEGTGMGATEGARNWETEGEIKGASEGEIKEATGVERKAACPEEAQVDLPPSNANPTSPSGDATAGVITHKRPAGSRQVRHRRFHFPHATFHSLFAFGAFECSLFLCFESHSML